LDERERDIIMGVAEWQFNLDDNGMEIEDFSRNDGSIDAIFHEKYLYTKLNHKR
jgi:hypothetical protein